ncbi:MAG: radical SAM protein [Deltaproteobacteria bacterium]|jgi:radical SAM protein with 4Fe4S-binding SPASM domain|nr:radical SAM protein [Deltaproteobacteria bacterium]
MVSLGIGLTSDCNLNCAHCYRDQDHIENLTLNDIQTVCESIPISAIGFGTGENGLNPEYAEIIEYLHSRKIKLSLASNGYTLSITPDEKLTYFSDVEFSVDFPDQQRQDAFRGQGNWQTVMDGLTRCRRLGIRVSILAVLMNVNYKDLGKIAALSGSLGADFRVNVYQPMYTTEFMPSFDQYWQAFNFLFKNTEIISVSEPLVNTFLGINGLKGTPCGGHSMRLTPDGYLKACVYWPESDLTIADLIQQKEAIFDSPYFQQTHQIPQFCLTCEHVDNCGGGCAARRKLRNRFDKPDEFCPIFRNKPIKIEGRLSSATKPTRTGSICTTIIRTILHENE